MEIAGQTMTVTQGRAVTYASRDGGLVGPAARRTRLGHRAGGCAGPHETPGISITVGHRLGDRHGDLQRDCEPRSRRATRDDVRGAGFERTQAGQPCTYTLTPARVGAGDATTGTVYWRRWRLRLTATSSAPW